MTPQPRIPKAQDSPTGQDTQIAAGGNPRGTGGQSAGDPNNIQWPRDKYPNKKAPPGPGYRPPTAKKKVIDSKYKIAIRLWSTVSNHDFAV